MPQDNVKRYQTNSNYTYYSHLFSSAETIKTAKEKHSKRNSKPPTTINQHQPTVKNHQGSMPPQNNHPPAHREHPPPPPAEPLGLALGRHSSADRLAGRGLPHLVASET
jgi:hypothetical protein